MVMIAIGNTYQSRDGDKFIIISAIEENNFGYDQGFRFKGITPLEGESTFLIQKIVLFKPNGSHAGPGISTTPSDLIALIHKSQGLIKEGEVKPGDIAADMTDHKAGVGPFQGWDVYGSFTITKRQYKSLLDSTPTHGRLIQNRTAHIVSITIDVDGNVSAIMVIYQYDTKYYMASLFMPKELQKTTSYGHLIG